MLHVIFHAQPSPCGVAPIVIIPAGRLSGELPVNGIIGTYWRAATARLQLRRVVDRHEAGATLFPRCRNFLQSHAAVVAIGSPIPSEVLSTAMNRSRFPGQ